jgi:hypothetical protein
MSIVRVQSKNNTVGGGSSNTVTATLTSTATAGNLLVVFACSNNSAAPTISDNNSNVYTTIDTAGDSGNGKAFGILAYLKNIPSGITSVTASNFNFNQGEIEVVEYSGLDTTAPLDVHSGHNNVFGTAAFTSNTTGTSAQAGSLAFGAVGSPPSTDGAWSGIDAAWTQFDSGTTNGHYVFGEQLSAGIATYVFSGSNSAASANNTAFVAVFKPASSASPLRFNSSLSGLGASGPFFHNRLA